MNSFLRQSTASQARGIGPFLDDTDFKTAETGLTIANTDIKLVINGGGGGAANKNSGGGTHRVNGVYGVTFDATDTATVGEMFVSVVVSGALPVFATFIVLEEAVYDALFLAAAPGFATVATAALIKANTDNLPSDPADASDIAALLSAFPLKRNTAGQHMGFYMRDTGDTQSGKTGACTVQKCIDGAGAWSSTSGTVTEIGNGECDFSPSAGDCNGVHIKYRATLSGAVDVVKEIWTHV